MRKHLYILLFTLLAAKATFSQKEKTALWEGNKLYKEKQFDKAREEYNKALAVSPNNSIANYNMGNAQFRLNKLDESIKFYDNVIASKDKSIDRAKAFFNKGIALQKLNKLDESIRAFKETLKLDPKDEAARANLQKAIQEKKRREREMQEKKEQDQNKNDQQSKMKKEKVDQLLKSLEQKEKELQKKMQRNSPSPNKPEKDW